MPLLQQKYIRGIRGWNSNLEDIRTQAALVEPPGNCFHSDHAHFSCDVDGHERVACARTAISREYDLQASKDLDGPFASAFPTRPLEALRACFDICEDDDNGSSPKCERRTSFISTSQQKQKSDFEGIGNDKDERLERSTSVPSDISSRVQHMFLSGSLLSEHVLSSYKNSSVDAERDDLRQKNLHERNPSGPLLLCQLKNSSNFSSDVTAIERKGRFQITPANGVQKVAPLPNSFNAAPRKVALNAASLLHLLQVLLHQNAMQEEELIKLIKCVEQTSGLSKGAVEVSDASSISFSQAVLASTVERELQPHVANLQKSVSKLADDVQKLRQKNSQLEQKINALIDKKRIDQDKY